LFEAGALAYIRSALSLPVLALMGTRAKRSIPMRYTELAARE